MVNDEHRADLAPPAVPALDTEKYRQYVDEFDIPDERKLELLQTLWWIMAAFVDLGFGVDSVQRALPALADFSSTADSDALEEGNAGAPERDAKKGSADE